MEEVKLYPGISQVRFCCCCFFSLIYIYNVDYITLQTKTLWNSKLNFFKILFVTLVTGKKIYIYFIIIKKKHWLMNRCTERFRIFCVHNISVSIHFYKLFLNRCLGGQLCQEWSLLSAWSLKISDQHPVSVRRFHPWDFFQQ